jgi:hypothetical protein
MPSSPKKGVDSGTAHSRQDHPEYLDHSLPALPRLIYFPHPFPVGFLLANYFPQHVSRCFGVPAR